MGELQGEVQAGRDALQLAHPALPSADLVVVTIGGNDAGFARLLWKASRLAGPWPDAEQDIITSIRRARDGIARVFSSLRKLAPDAMVLAVGYPNVVPEDRERQRCPWLWIWWSHRGQDLIRLAAEEMDRVLDEVAREQGIHFVDLRTAFSGHEACAPDEWIRGPVAGWLPGVRGPSLHPNGRGHEAIAGAISAHIARQLKTASDLTPRGLPANPQPQID